MILQGEKDVMQLHLHFTFLMIHFMKFNSQRCSRKR